MATLEKIRSKSVMLFTIIIIALLAFILGDFLTSGRSFFGPGDTVAEANGAKVKFNEYQKRVSELSEQQKAGQQAVDNDVLGQQAIDQLLTQALLQKEYDKLGISVTSKEFSKIMLGEQSEQAFQTLMGQFGQGAQVLVSKGITTSRTFYDAMQNPGKYGLTPADGEAMKTVWTDLENNIEQSLQGQAYGALLNGLFTANQLDAKAVYNDRNTSRHFSYVRKEISSVPDDKVKLTDDDYKAVYDRHKGAFKINEETRAVSYIIVPIVPSDADYAAGQKEFEDVLVSLKDNEVSAVLAKHPEFVSQNVKYTRQALAADPQLRALTTDSAALAAGTVRPAMMVGGQYALAKVLTVSSEVDNLKFSAFGLGVAEMDSLRNTLTTASFDSIARQNGGFAGQQISLVNPAMQLNDRQKEGLANTPVNQIFFVNDTITGQGKDGKAVSQVYTTAFMVTEREAPVPVYDLAKVTYNVVPSTQTVNDLNAKFHAYVANNATAETFAKNAEKSGYQAGTALVSASTPLVGNAPSSRGCVKWAMNNKKGKVSPVFSNQNGGADYLMAVAVDDVFSGKYLPVSSEFVRNAIKPQVMAEKKADMLVKEYAGKAKDLAGYAKIMGGTVNEGDAVFGDDQISGVGFGELALQGVIAGAKPGTVAGPVKGTSAVFVVNVANAKTEGRPYNYDESAMTFVQKFVAPMMQNPLQMLVGDGKYKNNILEFTPDQVN